jgi:hypothetical protein
MNEATKLVSAAIWKMVPLIVTAAFFLLAAGAAGFVLVRQNPQWSRATKQLVHSGLVFVAAVLWVVFFLFRWRSAG